MSLYIDLIEHTVDIVLRSPLGALFPSSQQLPLVSISDTWKAFWSNKAHFQSPLPCLILCLQNYRWTRTLPGGTRGVEVPGTNTIKNKLMPTLIVSSLETSQLASKQNWEGLSTPWYTPWYTAQLWSVATTTYLADRKLYSSFLSEIAARHKHTKNMDLRASSRALVLRSVVHSTQQAWPIDERKKKQITENA